MKYVEGPEYYPYPALDAAGYRAKVEHLLQLYPWEIQLAQLNLLSSHDIARALTVVAEDQTSFELAVLLQMTFPGPPSIYYGDEVGLAGGTDPDNRYSFPAEKDWNLDLLSTHKDLIALRHAHPALRTGSYETLATEGLCYVFKRSLPEETVLVAVNVGESAVTVELTRAQLGSDSPLQKTLYGSGKGVWQNESLRLTVPVRSGLVMG